MYPCVAIGPERGSRPFCCFGERGAATACRDVFDSAHTFLGIQAARLSSFATYCRVTLTTLASLQAAAFGGKPHCDESAILRLRLARADERAISKAAAKFNDSIMLMMFLVKIAVRARGCLARLPHAS